MGGRGGSSGISGAGKEKGFDVTVNGETTRYYFSSHGGTNYYQRGIGGTPEPTPLNMTAKQFRARVESNGASTKTVSNKEYKKELEAAKSYKEKTNKFLDEQWYKAGPRPRKGMKGH